MKGCGRRLLLGLLLALPWLARPSSVAAAEAPPHALTLEEAQTLALSHNFTVAIEREARTSAALAIRREQGAYDLGLGWDASFEKRTDPVNSLLSGAPPGRVAPDARALDLEASLSRLLPSGGSLSLLASARRDSTDNSFALLSPSYGTALGIELRQPLLRDRAIDPVRRRIRVARSDARRSLAGLQRVVAETLAAVDAAYWSLTAARHEVDVRAEAVKLAEQQLAETRARISAGTLPDNEEAQPRAELERRKGELLASQEQAVRAENALKALILDEGRDPLWATRLVPSDSAEVDARPLDLPAALRAADERRPEIAEAKESLAARAVDLRAARDERLPRLDLYASYARRGLAGSLSPDVSGFLGEPPIVPADIDGGFGRSVGTIGDGLYPDLRLGFSFAVPLGNRAAKAGLAIAASGQRQAELALAQLRQAVRVEVLNAAAAVEATSERTVAARAAREAAAVQLRAEQDRFQVGMSTNFLVLTRQNDLSRARLDEIQALSDHRKALTELARASGRLLEERHVVLGENAPRSGAPGGVE